MELSFSTDVVSRTPLISIMLHEVPWSFLVTSGLQISGTVLNRVEGNSGQAPAITYLVFLSHELHTNVSMVAAHAPTEIIGIYGVKLA